MPKRPCRNSNSKNSRSQTERTLDWELYILVIHPTVCATGWESRKSELCFTAIDYRIHRPMKTILAAVPWGNHEGISGSIKLTDLAEAFGGTQYD